MASSRRPWGERFDAWTKQKLPLVVFFFLAVLLSSLFNILDAADKGTNWFETHFMWRRAEYRKLTSLVAGYTLEKYKAVLGPPVFATTRTVKKSIYTFSTFRGRDYWVEAVADSSGTVVQYAVTSCDASFNPAFLVGKGNNAPLRVTLNKSTFTELDPMSMTTAHYYLSGATSSSYAFEEFYGGNPYDYKNYAWGLNDACGWNATDGDPLYRLRSVNKSFQGFSGPPSSAGAAVNLFRRTAMVNTYVESAPFKDLVEAGDFGVDRLLTRTVG